MLAPDDYTPYNPLDDENLAQNVADALEREPVHRMPLSPFKGPGLYAIYYVGQYELYKPLADICRREGTRDSNDLGPFAIPIYVGKAAASGSRKGTLRKRERELYSRLREHTNSIKSAATTLDVSDFRVRYLRVKDIWIPLGEYGIINKYKPIWNRVIDGFGNHDQGGGRNDQSRSPWDMVHPGRPFAMKLSPHPDGVEVIRGRVRAAVTAIVTSHQIPEDLLTVSEAEALRD
ncbi:Eco29kI family restriction endonuclease [Streptosporangium nondiastaticum]|uniref:Eco29kI family restriction endonuclease n=1 Tax=Streptosporangium nondiastaticum TaxID=35764 RepID=UPI0031F8CD47